MFYGDPPTWFVVAWLLLMIVFIGAWFASAHLVQVAIGLVAIIPVHLAYHPSSVLELVGGTALLIGVSFFLFLMAGTLVAMILQLFFRSDSP